MANTVLNPDIIAREAVMILENNCVFGKLFYRGYEDEFDSVNGYKVGSTIRVRRPTDFTVRTGDTASIQDVTEVAEYISIDTKIGVDFQFSSTDLTLKIGELSERVIKPAMIQLANKIDQDCAAQFKYVPNWVPGTTLDGNPINSFGDFAKGPTRLDNQAVPMEGRGAVLSPDDAWGLLGAQATLYSPELIKQAYTSGSLGNIGGCQTYMSQNLQTLTTGTRAGPSTARVNGSQTTTWATSGGGYTMTLLADGFGTTTTVAAGEVFTINNVYAVNPVTKATLNYLQPFSVVSAVTSDGGGGGTATLTITPPIIATGAFQTVSAAPADNATITFFGTASTSYVQNMLFRKNAFALVVPPLTRPPGAVDVSRQSYKGFNVRVAPYWSGSNDISAWRLDVLYGIKAIDPRQACRINGSS